MAAKPGATIVAAAPVRTDLVLEAVVVEDETVTVVALMLPVLLPAPETALEVLAVA